MNSLLVGDRHIVEQSPQNEKITDALDGGGLFFSYRESSRILRGREIEVDSAPGKRFSKPRGER
jgi:hypothetical protein